MTKASTDAQANFKTQSESMTQQLTSLQESLKAMRKTNEEQSKQFSDNLSEMQKANASLQESLRRLSEQNSKMGNDYNMAKNQIADLATQLEKSQHGKNILIMITVTAIILAALIAIL